MIIFVAYRDWALRSIESLNEQSVIVQTNDELDNCILEYKKNIEAIVFIGWSSIIHKDVISSYLCMCYHPSDLPLYRGGSPLQHQIIDGLTNTMGTLFKMDSGIDTGPIHSKIELSLEGDMTTIVANMTVNAHLLIKNFIEELKSGKDLNFQTQATSNTSYLKRRTPDMSEITLDELQSKSGLYLYNKIRSLGDPYPNAFIKTNDNKKLLIKVVELV